MVSMWEARFILFAAISFISVAFGGIALFALRDRDMARGLFFSRVREIIKILPVLQWGMMVPLVAALALMIVGLVVDSWMFMGVAGVLLIVSLVSLNYVIIVGAIKLLGWR
jgi:hypothetical protein